MREREREELMVAFVEVAWDAPPARVLECGFELPADKGAPIRDGERVSTA